MSTQFRRRDAHTYWWNPEPITYEHEALSLLLSDGGSRHPTHLRLSCLDGSLTWEIVCPWYREGSSGADSWGENYFDVSDGLVKHLRQEGLVTPFIEKGCGCAREDPDRLVISNPAKQYHIEYENGLRWTARTFLKVGIHTDLVGFALSRGSGREHGRFGRLYADFETPNGDICRVYPEQREVVCPYPPKQESTA